MSTQRPKRPDGRLQVPLDVGERVVSSYRVSPFLSDEVLTVSEVRNLGTRTKPKWRVLCKSPRGEGWIDAEELTKVSVLEAIRARERVEMEGLLAAAGFDPAHVARLQAEEMGPEELRSRLAIASGVGSLQHTHGFLRREDVEATPARRKSAQELDDDISAFEVNNRLFSAVFPTGISYADRSRERHGDYLRLAFLPFRSLELEWEPRVRMPQELRAAIERDARKIQDRRGQPYEVSASGQTVILGR